MPYQDMRPQRSRVVIEKIEVTIEKVDVHSPARYENT